MGWRLRSAGLIVALLAAMVPATAAVADDGQLPAIYVGAEGETVRTVDGEILLIETPGSGGGCTGVWWSIVDDLPRAVDFEVTVNRVSGAMPGESTHNFNAFSTDQQFDGTAFDFDPGPGKVAHPFTSGGTTGACGSGFIQTFELVNVVVTEFVVPLPEPAEAAFEVVSVPTGADGRGCQTFLWETVPDIGGATEYSIERFSSTSGDPLRTVDVLAPSDFDPAPSANSLGVGSYDGPNRLGHFLLTTARASGGCPWLEWQLLVEQLPHFISVDFTVSLPDCFGRAPTIIAVPGVTTIGTSGPDVIWGTAGADVIRGNGGDDRICARGGADVVRGNGGDDRIDAGGGADQVFGGRGADLVRGGKGRDILAGNGGPDDLFGNGGADVLRGGAGRDLLDGGRGRDQCAGGPGVDTLRRC